MLDLQTGQSYTLRPTAPAAAPPRPVRRAPFAWRVRNRVRMVAHGEVLVPLVVAALALIRFVAGNRFLSRVPLLGWLAKGLGGVAIVHARLYGRVTHADGGVTDYGLLGTHLIVTAGKNYIASVFDNTAEPENAKYHGYGTGTNAAAAGDTALQTELTTQYAVDSTRPTGSQAHGSPTYTTVGTLAPDSGGTIAVTEWGLFTASSSTTLIDRQVFSAVNLVAANGDTLATTYVLTIG